MLINIISNIHNMKGLEKDTKLLKHVLESFGHSVQPWNFTEKWCPPADLNIFLETLVPSFMDCAPKNWYYVNPEWVVDEYKPHLYRLDLVLCKTRYAELIMKGLGFPTHYTGFLVENKFDSTIPRDKSFLHIAGDSIVKGTRAIVDCWNKYNIPYPLILVTSLPQEITLNKNITWYNRLPEEDLRRYQNECLFSIQPSETEGFGHIIHEALSTYNLVLTTNAPPMRDLAGVPKELLIDFTSTGNLRLAKTYYVSPETVKDAVERAMALTDIHIEEIMNQTMKDFNTEQNNFLKRIEEIL